MPSSESGEPLVLLTQLPFIDFLEKRGMGYSYRALLLYKINLLYFYRKTKYLNYYLKYAKIKHSVILRRFIMEKGKVAFCTLRL